MSDINKSIPVPYFLVPYFLYGETLSISGQMDINNSKFFDVSDFYLRLILFDATRSSQISIFFV